MNYTVKEVAILKNVAVSTVYSWLRNGYLKNLSYDVVCNFVASDFYKVQGRPKKY